MNIKNPLVIKATVVANEFIDKYMPSANGEYVKVYLYILRHEQDKIEVTDIADALNHTEADVRRALAYWKKFGILEDSEKADRTEREDESRIYREKIPAGAGVSAVSCQMGKETAGKTSALERAGNGERKIYTPDEISSLADNEEFTQLLYIAQKYMNRLFTQRDSEIMAYLYDGLKLSAELIEYLIEYCVQNKHTSLRYMEKVALDWNEKGVKTVEQAKARTEGFSKDYFAVMRAFGLNERRPGASEITYLEKWFGNFGFPRKIVVAACNRTIEAIHQPSFQYADKILSEWKKAGVKSLEDIEALGSQRRKNAEGEKNPGRKSSSSNRFHNFEQRSTDYDALVMELWQKEK